MIPDSTLRLIQILEKTVSSDKNELEAAQNYLEQAAASSLVEYIKTLSEILSHGANTSVVRMAAGLQLKNCLTSKDLDKKQEYQKRWLTIPLQMRAYIKEHILAALGTETMRPSAAAQCTAYIAVIELPAGHWPELISVLVANITAPNTTELVREATLEAIGYICQDIDAEVLASQSNEILTAIVHGMKREEPSNHVRLAATNALLNSLEFTKANFEKETERHFIMQVVCEATQSPETKVRVAALQCLVKIMSLYYQYMEHYMGPALFAITLESMRSKIDDIELQGIEFWSNVCDEEVDLAIEASEAAEMGRPPEHTSKFYAKGALQYLVPVLMETLTKQEDGDDEDDWNPCKAAGVCLMLLANCCEDVIVPHVLPFVKDNIEDPDWRNRDAAVMAFGSILEGPDPAQLKPIVEQALPYLFKLMHDPSVNVRDTAAWTIGRVCEIIPDAAVSTNNLQPLLQALVSGLAAEPRVASNVCWAFSSLAEAAYETASQATDAQEPATYCLSEYFEPIVQKLLETTDRADGAQANLRAAAYEALMEMVKNSPRDCYITVQKTTMVILERLQQVLNMESHVQSSSDRVQYNDLQSLLCATLQSVLRKVTPEDAPQISDPIMAALLQMFNASAGPNRAGGVQEDALMAVSTLTEVLGEGFLKYMEAFRPYLFMGLRNHAEPTICQASVGLIGDICRALGSKVLPFCDSIMGLLMEVLSNNDVDRKVKPQILAVFGDMALAIGPDFKKYLEMVLNMLQQASQAQVNRNDFDVMDYLNELRECCLDAYTGIVQGLKGDDGGPPSPDVQFILSHVPHIITFITTIARDKEKSDGTISAAAGLIGDLCTAFGAHLLPLVDTEPITEMLAIGRRSKTTKTKTLSNWATKEIRRLKTPSSS